MRPTKRLFWFAIGWTLLGLAAALNNWLPGPWSQPDWQPQLEKIWQISSATLVFLLLFDGIIQRALPELCPRRGSYFLFARGSRCLALAHERIPCTLLPA